MNHLLKLIEATHILCSTAISEFDLDRAQHLLSTFVNEFEILYGQQNMVFNVHLLIHTAKCVKLNGPLFTYSNYSTEDNLAHIVDFIKGTTDVLLQIADRYMLERNLFRHLQSSRRASNFNEQLKCKHFSVTSKLGNCILVGKGHVIDRASINFIYQELNLEHTEKVFSHRAVFIDCKVYYETATLQTKSKRTYDSFVCSPNEQIYGEIENILIVRNQIWFVVNNKYTVKENSRNIGKIQINLVEKQEEDILIARAEIFIEKFALMKTNVIICSKFPNLYERN